MPTIAPIPIKRGGTFTASTTYTPAAGGTPNLLGATVTSQVLDSCKARHSLACALNGAGLVITSTASASLTYGMSSGPAKWDIRVELGGVVIYTETADLIIGDPVTLPA